MTPTSAQPALDLPPAPSELAWDFPERSPGAARHPATVPLAEQRAELEAELDRRKRLYPRSVERGTMTAATMEHELAVFAAMVDDYRRSLQDPRPFTLDWRSRIIALRRELAMRRAAYPKWVASGSNPLTQVDATARLERLDAVYHQYWRWLFCFDAPAMTLDLDATARAAELRRQRGRVQKFHARQLEKVGAFA